MTLDFNEVVKFMKEFKIDTMNRFGELIVDTPTNTYVSIKNCKDMDDVKTYVVYAISRPIYKGLDDIPANRLLKRFNDYFEVKLSRDDMGLIYQELCYTSKLAEFKEFVKDGFPMDKLMKVSS